MQLQNAIFIIITICNISVNTLPAGSGSPLGKKRVYGYKKTQNLGIKQTLKIMFYETGQSEPFPPTWVPWTALKFLLPPW